MRKGLRDIGLVFLVFFLFLYILPMDLSASDMPSTIPTEQNIKEGFTVANELEEGQVILTKHGQKEYLGSNQWSYSTQMGITNTWNGSHYVKWFYNQTAKSVQIGNTTIFHNAGGGLTIEGESGIKVGLMKWYSQYYLNEIWHNVTLDNYQWIGFEVGSDYAVAKQRFWGAQGELNVSYIYRNNEEFKITVDVTNNAGQSLPVRLIWAALQLEDVAGNYELMYDIVFGKNVTVGIIIEDLHIFWLDARESDPNIAINTVLDKPNRRAAVIFGNQSSILGVGQTYTLDPSVNPVMDNDENDDWWWYNYTGGWHLEYHYTSNLYNYVGNHTNGEYVYMGQERFPLDIPNGATIVSANFTSYYSSNTVEQYTQVRRINEVNVGPLESDTSLPSISNDTVMQIYWDGLGAGWMDPQNVTNLVQEQVNLAGWREGYYFGMRHCKDIAQNTGLRWFDYQAANDYHAYMNVTYTAEEDYVDQISDLHDPSDTGTHSDFQEERDKDGTYDTLTEADTGSDSLLLDCDDYDGLYSSSEWTLTGTSPYLSTANYPTDIIETNTDNSYEGYFTFANVTKNYGLYSMNITARGYALDGVGGEHCYFYWGHNGSYYSGGDFQFENSLGYKTVTITGEKFTAEEINNIQGYFLYDSVGGKDWVLVDYVYLGVTQDANYDLDLEVAWNQVEYSQDNEELCIFGGTQGAEALRVDVWSGSWVNVFTDIAAGWNNVSVSSYLTSSTFEIRFTDTSNDSTLADTWQVEAVLLHTWSDVGEFYVSIYEVVGLFDTVTSAVNLSTTVNELIGIYDSTILAVSYVVTIFEQIVLSESVNTGLVYIISIFSIIGLAATASTTLSASATIFEQIGLDAVTTVSASFSNTIFEVIDLSDTVSTQIIEAGQYFVTVNEIIDLSDTVSTVFSGVVVVYEIIPIWDSSTSAVSVVITVFEIIPFFDSATADYPVYSIVIYEIIPITDTFGFVGGEVVTVTTGILYQMFLSLEMWGYLGPALLVIGGYFVAKERDDLGVIYFVVECLVVSYYLTLVAATPDYWWHIIIVLLGGLLTCIYPLWDK